MARECAQAACSRCAGQSLSSDKRRLYTSGATNVFDYTPQVPSCVGQYAQGTVAVQLSTSGPPLTILCESVPSHE
eukprot:1121991-Rhodomonas_salina.3